jgi:hypothetical protein
MQPPHEGRTAAGMGWLGWTLMLASLAVGLLIAAYRLFYQDPLQAMSDRRRDVLSRDSEDVI